MADTSELPRVMTPGMIAKVWHCSERHVRKLISTGELPSFRAGGKLIRIRGEDVEAYEQRNNRHAEDESDLPSTSSAPVGRAARLTTPAPRARLDPLQRARIKALRNRLARDPADGEV